MKHLYTLAITLTFAFSAQAQVVFQSDLSDWLGGIPTDFFGARTSTPADSATEVMNNVIFGTSAANLVNASMAHDRFTTQPLPMQDGDVFTVEFWVRGEGEVRAGIFDGRVFQNGFVYSPYNTINTTTWTKITEVVSCGQDTAAGEFIISYRNTSIGVGIDVDSMAVTLGAPPANMTSIFDIQFTTDPSGDSPLSGQQVITGGVVTAVDSVGYFIQENEAAWSGIFVFDNSLPSRGDSVVVEGTVTEFFTSTQIANVSNVTNAGAVGEPNSVIVSTGDANLENWESVLINIGGVCTDDDVAANFGQWEVNDGSGPMLVDNQFFSFNPVLGLTYVVTGPMTINFGERKMLPRDGNDVSIPFSVAETLFSDLLAYPNPATDNFTIDLGDNQDNLEYVLLDITGRVMSSGSFNGRIASFNVSDLANGQYVLQLAQNGASQRISFAVQH